MKKRIYLKIADGRRSHPVKASSKRDYRPLEDSLGNALPTVVIALNVKMDSDIFYQAQKEMDLKIENPEIASEINIEKEENENTKEEELRKLKEEKMTGEK